MQIIIGDFIHIYMIWYANSSDSNKSDANEISLYL